MRPALAPGVACVYFTALNITVATTSIYNTTDSEILLLIEVLRAKRMLKIRKITDITNINAVFTRRIFANSPLSSPSAPRQRLANPM